MINGKSIELVSVVSTREYMEPTVKAIKKSLQSFNHFDNVTIICPQNAQLPRLEFNQIVANFTHDNYSEFMVKRLGEFVSSDFCMTIQWDSCIIDPTAWTDKFLDYDYIGAPWQNAWINRVGNGGMSLRSRKFLTEVSKLNYIKTDNFILNNEDVVCCVLNYEYLLSKGVKFAPLLIARQFSVERPIAEYPHLYNDISTYNSFCFHGDFNIAGLNYIDLEQRKILGL